MGFFTEFPRVAYSINNDGIYDMPVNIMVRIRVLTDQLDKMFHYYEYSVKEGETPEIVAEKFYGDAEAHWLVLMTNNRTDPQFDWVLHYDAFKKYIVAKYGSFELAQSTTHHYEKIYKTVDNTTQEISYTTLEIQQDEYDTLPVEEGSPIVYTVGTSTVDVYEPYRNSVSNYDWELDQNEKKRQIKLIKKEYYTPISKELYNILLKENSKKSTFIRKLTF